jgi:DMSO/TMAO reductase YedYZ heme-binding membrane subunit
VAVAWGVVAMQLLLALQVSSLLKSRMSHRTWRRVHHLAGPTFVLATVHLLTAGTDATHPVVLSLVAGTAIGALFLGLVRLWSPRGRFPKPPRPETSPRPEKAPRPAPTAAASG